MGELSADQFRDDELASNRGNNAVAASESPIADAVALATKFAHDRVPAERYWDDAVEPSVSNVYAGFARALVRKRPAVREHGQRPKERSPFESPSHKAIPAPDGKPPTATRRGSIRQRAKAR